MLRQSQSFSLCQWAVFLVLFAATTTRAETAAAVSPFFDRHEQGISVTESESESGVHRQIQQTLDAAMDRRRNLATGYLPNLPRYGSNSGSPTSNSAFTPPMTASGSGNSNGGSTGYMPTYDSGSATATDSQPPLTPLPQGSANGSGMPPPPPPLGGNGNGGSGIPPPAHPGMGKGYLGPGPGSNNVKKGLPKKGTKKGQTKGGGYSYGKGSGSGSGGTGSGNGTSSGTGNGMGSGNGTSSGSGTSSSGGGGGGRPMVTPHFDDDTLNTPATAQPCLCTASSCHCQNGVATDYEFVLVRPFFPYSSRCCCCRNDDASKRVVVVVSLSHYYLFVSNHNRFEIRLEVTHRLKLNSVLPVALE